MNQHITSTVVTGSASQVPPDIAEQLGIEILPLKIYVMVRNTWMALIYPQ